MLNNEAIKEFREIYFRIFREEIDEKTAQDKARRLLELIKVIYKNYEPRKKDN